MFDHAMIAKARKLNQRNKAQKRGKPTAGIDFAGRIRVFHTGGTLRYTKKN